MGEERFGQRQALQPFNVRIQNPVSGATTEVTVIGIMSLKLASAIASGIYVNAATYTPVYGTPDFQRTYVRLAKGVDATTPPRASSRR